MAGTEEKKLKNHLDTPKISDIALVNELKDELLSKINSLFEEKKIPEDIREKIITDLLEKFPDIITEKIDSLRNEIARDALRAAIATRKELAERIKREEKKRAKEEMFQRFNLHFRIQHMILFTSVILLILSGLPMKFPDFYPFIIIVNIFGGIDSTRILHRVAATLLVIFMGYHTIYTIFHREGRRDFFLLLPRFKDVLDVIQNIKYFLGISNEKPKFGRFSYVEKFDYWAVYWGCVIMIGSGALMWFQEISLNLLPKFILDAAKEAHSDEALLATLAIVIWHFYNVHFNPDKFPGSLTWFHGKISREEMVEHHPLEYEEIMREKRNKESEENKGNDN